MAVTITAAEFRAALRLGDTTEETAEATRILASVSALVLKHAPNAPDAIHSEAAVRAGGWLFDMPAAQRTAAGDVLRNSGALALLLPYRTHRAGTTG